jgi:Mrp family chromosome partitioning ATPase
MGRLLETLKHGPKAHPEQCVVDWTLREPDEVPYIEVGSGRKVEGSTEVMAVKHPPQPPGQPPHLSAPTLPVERAALANGKAVALTEAKPMGVVFEPWPAMLVPSRGIAPEVIAFHQPNHVITQQYASLLGKILEGQNSTSTRAILLSGSKPNVGTTTALLNLAVVAATLDKRRLALVDAHLMRPALAQRLGLSVANGLLEVLAGQAALEPTVVRSPVAGMYLLAARGDDNAAIGHLAAEAFSWLLRWLKERFDLVLIDGPGMDEGAEITAIAPVCDGVYLVVPQGDIAPPHRAMAQNIGRHGGRLMGLIHTHRE